jgi:hypothetical protein
VQLFLGFYNFYRIFLKNYDRTARPLTSLTYKDAWHPLYAKELEAFEKLKELVLSDEVRAYYSPDRKIRIKTDASNGVVAGVLTQKQKDGFWRLVIYFSKTMSPEKIRYEIHDKKILAVIRAI